MFTRVKSIPLFRTSPAATPNASVSNTPTADRSRANSIDIEERNRLLREILESSGFMERRRSTKNKS